MNRVGVVAPADPPHHGWPRHSAPWRGHLFRCRQLSKYTRQGWELKLLGAARAVSRISISRCLGTGSGRNARTQLRERITASSIAAALAVLECSKLLHFGGHRFFDDAAIRGALAPRFAYWGMNVLPDGPTPVTWIITSPSFAHV